MVRKANVWGMRHQQPWETNHIYRKIDQISKYSKDNGNMFLLGGKESYKYERERTRINCQWCWTGIWNYDLKLWFSVYVHRNKNRWIYKCIFAHIWVCISHWLTQWTWTWANFGRQWRTGKHGTLQCMGLQRVRQDWVTELLGKTLNWLVCIWKTHPQGELLALSTLGGAISSQSGRSQCQSIRNIQRPNIVHEENKLILRGILKNCNLLKCLNH